MTTSKTNSNVNGKIEHLHTTLLELIHVSSRLRIDENVSLISTALKLANLNVWRGKIIHDCSGKVPLIEPPISFVPLDFDIEENTEFTFEIAKAMCDKIAFAINVIVDIFEDLSEQEDVFVSSELTSEIEQEVMKLVSVEKAFARVIDSLSDASNWINYHLEKTVFSKK